MSFPDREVRDLLGRRGLRMSDVIAGAEVGSTVHGISVGDQDDYDMTLVRWETWNELINGDLKRQSMMIRTQPDGERSGPGDIDLNVYTLRKFVALAAKGNPSILLVLHVPEYLIGPTLEGFPDDLRGLVRSQRAGAAFLGYMRQQMERWMGVRGQKNVTRPELVEKYGFDTKYAAHIIRLGYQGTAYLTEGHIPVPLPTDIAESIRDLRTGGVDEYEAMRWAAAMEEELKHAYDNSRLPESPDEEGIRNWLRWEYGIHFGVKHD